MKINYLALTFMFAVTCGLAAPGDIDPFFVPAVGESYIGGVPVGNGGVTTVSLQKDGKILIGGHFVSANGWRSGKIARLNTDGTTDQSFFADIDLTVRAIAVQKDGKILIGGDFTSINGEPRKYLARLNPNGLRAT